MTLNEVVEAVKRERPSAEAEVVKGLAVQLSELVYSEIFSPSGLLPPEGDELCLSLEQADIYVTYITSRIALMEGDTEMARLYTEQWQAAYRRLAALYRRSNMPAKNTPLRGGVLN